MADRYRTVEGIRGRPPRWGLLPAVERVTDDHRFTEGIAWLPEWKVDGHAIAMDGLGVTAARAGSIASVPAEQRADPFLVWAGELASTLGSNRGIAERVRRKQENTASYQIALEFWDGAIATAQGHQSVTLRDIDSNRMTDIATPVTIVVGMGLIEAGLADALMGQVGMIHCTPAALLHMVNARLVENTGTTGLPVWRTPMGHIVVADAGYSGNGPGIGAENPAGTSQWIYGTSLVGVRLGPIQMLPGDIETREALDTNLNNVTVIAQQPCVIQWDSTAHVAAEVSVPAVDLAATS